MTQTEETVCLSVLLPAVQSCQKGNSLQQITEQCGRSLNTDPKNIQLFKLVPLTQDDLFNKSEDGVHQEIAVRILKSDVSLRKVEDTLAEKIRLEQMVDKTSEALKAYFEELKRIKKALMTAMTPPQLQEGEGSAEAPNMSTDAVLKKLSKFKTLVDDNKKLKKLLKTQLDSSEKLRAETQSTVETLREEFDHLVQELGRYKSKEKAQASAGQKKGQHNSKLQDTFGQGGNN